MDVVATWLLSLMVWQSPPERAMPYGEESSERTTRYGEIAADLRAVAYDPAIEPLFGGADGRARTAALVLAVALKETALARDADVGPCEKGRCDGGRAACLMQIRIGAGSTREGWTQADLFGDRRKCFRSGVELLRRSMRACRHLPVDARLSAYASGACSRGGNASRARYRVYGLLVGRGPLPVPDAAFLASGVRQEGQAVFGRWISGTEGIGPS